MIDRDQTQRNLNSHHVPLHHVMFVSPVGDIGGGEQVLLALARHLPTFGYSADIICLRPGPLQDAAREIGVFTAAWQHHRMRDLRKVLAARHWLYTLIKQRRPHIVHCNHMAHLYGRSAARRGGAKEVWHIHDYPHRVDWADRLCRLVSTDQIVFTTPYVKSGYPLLARRYPYSVIPPVAPHFPATKPGPNRVRQRLGLPRNGPLFLMAARLQSHKGHATLLAAAKQVMTQSPDVGFVVTGSPVSPRQAAYLTQLSNLACELGVDSAVHFVGHISEEDLVALYGESVALVHPATTEGFGLAIVSALRAGLPVIAADAEGPRYVLDSGELGMMVPRGDADALAVAMISHLQNPPSRERLDKIAMVADARFSPLKMAEDVASVYDNLLGKKSDLRVSSVLA